MYSLTRTAPSTARQPRELPFAIFLVRELAIWLSLYGVYLLVRGQTLASFGQALSNAHRVVHVERVTALDHERLIQQATRAAGGLDGALAQYYEFGFFPVVITGLLLLGARDRARYREVRSAMLLAIGAAAVLFALMPTAPPRLVPSLGLVDTVGMNAHDVGSFYGVPYNPYAAMPSMHVGWTLLLAVGLYGLTHRRLLRGVIAAHPVIMSLAVVATGNHYLLDAIVGFAIALVALALVRMHSRPADERPERRTPPRACLPTA